MDSTMNRRYDPRVDTYIDALPDWQADLCHQLREVIHAADPDIAETIIDSFTLG